MFGSKKSLSSSSSTTQQQQVHPNDEYTVMYHTYSVCPVCSFMEQQGVDSSKWKPSQVVNHRNRVYQRIECETHGVQTLLLCSNTAFFDRCLSFTPGVLDVVKGKSTNTPMDIEELDKRISHEHQSNIMNIPFMVDCNLYESDQFVTDDALKHQTDQILHFIPQNKNFVLKLNAQLVPLNQMHILNAKVNHVLNFDSRIREQPIVLECSFDRISELAKLEDTVLLNTRVHPSVQIYIEKGREEQNTKELKHAYDTLKTIQNLQVIVRLVVSKPSPDLTSILELLRFEMVGFTRFIIIEMERTPGQIMKQFRPVDSQIENRFADAHEQADHSHSLDPLELLHNIEQCTNKQISITDFYPASVGMILEPMLRLLGRGNYNIRPSPFCGLATILINTDEQFRSVPVSRLFNIEYLYRQMVPLVKKLEKSQDNMGFFTARALKKAVNQSIIPKKQRQDNYELPSDFMSFLISEQKQTEATEMIDKIQFIIVHNQMDVGSIDIVKRSRCSLCSHISQTPNPNGKLIAQCTKCL